MRPQTSPRLARHLARLAVRFTRQRVRAARRTRPAARLDAPAAGVRLVPADRDTADAWLELTRHGRPPGEGLAASTLGGAARTRREWLARSRQLRRHVRRGEQRGYLVEADGRVVGEALAFLDAGTELAELVVWLADGADVHGPVIAMLTDDLLGTHARRVMFTAPVGDAGAAAVAAGQDFEHEGTLADPPFADRDVYVRHAGAAA